VDRARDWREKMKRKTNSTTPELDYLIVGAGPAGLQLGYFLERNNRNYLILEAGDSAGTFFGTFPRHRTMISINKVYTGCECPETNLRWDWNSLLSDNYEMPFSSYTKRYFPEADVFKKYLEDYREHYKLKVQFGARVSRVSKKKMFEVVDEAGNVYRSKRLVMAAGLTKPYIPPIPGIEMAESYFDFSVDPEDFKNKRVLIIGKGNSAFETANNLTETAASIHLCSPTPVTHAWKTHYVGHLRAINNNFLDTYQLKSQNAILDACIARIERRKGKFVVNIIYTHAKGERREILFDRVLLCAGFRFDDSIFDEECRPALIHNGKLPHMTSEWESANVKDLYFVGNLMQSRDYKKTMSGFVHGFRYNIRALDNIFGYKYHGEEWPSRKVSLKPKEITDVILGRVNTSSAMFLQPGFFCDVLVVPGAGQQALYYEDVPVDYVHDGELGKKAHYYTVSLEYGDFHTPPDPFNIERDPDPALAHLTAYLHPIIRYYSGASLIYEHHVPEDLENVYVAEKYSKPLEKFFRGQELEPSRQGRRANGARRKTASTAVSQ
jgi:thioredoxin reductase